MRIRIVLFLTVLLSVFSLSSCKKGKNTTETVNSNVNVNTEANTATAMGENVIETNTNNVSTTTIENNEINENNEMSSYYPYDNPYSYEVSSSSIIFDIIEQVKIDAWINNYYYKMDRNEMSKLPALYLMVKYFDISKEEFIRINEEKRHSIPDNIVSGLYASSESAAKETFVSPCALYHEGEIYTVYDFQNMSYNQIKALKIPREKLKRYSERMEQVFHVDFKSDYKEVFEEGFNALKQISSETNEIVNVYDPYIIIYNNMYQYSYDYLYRIDMQGGFYQGVGLFGLVEDDRKYSEWKGNFMSLVNPNGRPVNEYNVYSFIKEFQIPRDKFESEMIPYFPGYTTEIIDVLYSNDRKAIKELMATQTSLVVNEEVYNISWLASHTAKDYNEHGITLDRMDSYLNKLDKEYCREEQRAIYGIITKELKIEGINNINLQPFARCILAPYKAEYYGIDSFIYEIVEADKMEKWLEQFNYEICHEVDRSAYRPITECTVVNLVQELGVSKEDFIKVNDGKIYNQKQIDAIFSGDLYDINKAFKGDYTIEVKGSIYTVDWLLKHSVENFIKEGITEKMINNLNSKLSKDGFSIHIEY